MSPGASIEIIFFPYSAPLINMVGTGGVGDGYVPYLPYPPAHARAQLGNVASPGGTTPWHQLFHVSVELLSARPLHGPRLVQPLCHS